jgi:hypothetical protein
VVKSNLELEPEAARAAKNERKPMESKAKTELKTKTHPLTTGRLCAATRSSSKQR